MERTKVGHGSGVKLSSARVVRCAALACADLEARRACESRRVCIVVKKRRPLLAIYKRESGATLRLP